MPHCSTPGEYCSCRRACATPACRSRCPPAHLASLIRGPLLLPAAEDKHKVTYNRFITGSRDSGFFDEESMDFQERILHKSGLSEETFFPPGVCCAAGEAGTDVAALRPGVPSALQPWAVGGGAVRRVLVLLCGRALLASTCCIGCWAATPVRHAPRQLPRGLPTIAACLRRPPQPCNPSNVAAAHLHMSAGLHLDPPEFDMNWARQEAELVMFKAVDDLLRKAGLHPRQIDVLGEQT